MGGDSECAVIARLLLRASHRVPPALSVNSESMYTLTAEEGHVRAWVPNRLDATTT